MPTVITEGAMAARGFGFGAGLDGPLYIEDVFSTYLYTGNGSTQTITNKINLLGKGGVVWLKDRSVATDHRVFDTLRYLNSTNYYTLRTNTDNAQQLAGLYPNSTGFVVDTNGPDYNTNNESYASWTFRKQAKFFDIVTYTGTGANRTIAHNLGSTPGCIIVKRTDTTSDWQVYHSGLTSAAYSIQLNLTDGEASAPTIWNSTAPTSSVFSVGTSTAVNASGGTYVAYLFASNAGGFGWTGTDNVITCGSYTGTGINTTFNIGYEPQWIMFKRMDSAATWRMHDNMRGLESSAGKGALDANLASAESAGTDDPYITSAGFGLSGNNLNYNVSGATYIYIAIRRGPMKTPTDATKVFGISARTGTGANATVTGGQTDDAVLIKNRASAVASLFSSRLTSTRYLVTSSTAAEVAAGTTILQAKPWDVMDGVKVGTTSIITNASANTFVNYLFQRAPGFFDVVCYTGTGANTTQTHNLGVVPELMIVKGRSGATAWQVYSSSLANTEYLVLSTTAAKVTGATRWNSTTPTSTVFSLGTATEVNTSAATYVAYLFATRSGVSKVGSYSGTGATQTVNCGFTGGARFVMIKRTDSTGDWYVWDTARGMVSGTDPYLLLNDPAAEVNANSVYTATTGFQIVSTAAGINASGGSYIYLAIA